MTGALLSITYQASPIKRRRSTKAEVERRRAALFDIISAMKPMTVRQVFYQATVRGLVEKSEAGYTKVQTDLVQMRRAGAVPYDWLADNTRWQRKPGTFSSVEHALAETARFYRKSLWDKADAYVEVWLEKDALSGVIMPITAPETVEMVQAQGLASEGEPVSLSEGRKRKSALARRSGTSRSWRKLRGPKRSLRRVGHSRPADRPGAEIMKCAPASGRNDISDLGRALYRCEREAVSMPVYGYARVSSDAGFCASSPPVTASW